MTDHDDQQFREIAMTPESLHAAIKRAYAHGKAVLANGENVLVTSGPAIEPIGIKQRKFLHGPVLRQISEQVKVPTFNADGSPTGKTERYVTDTWKEYFKKRFLGVTYVMERGFVKDKVTGMWRWAHKATPKRIAVSSETLGPRRYSQWIDEIIDHCVEEYGVTFVFKDKERDEVRYRGPKGKSKIDHEADEADDSTTA